MDRLDLLAELDGLTQDERMARLIALGRRAQEPKVAALLDSLAQGDTYERWLVLQTCYSSRDTARLRAALADDSAALRRFALGLLLRFGDDATLVAVLAEQTPQQRVATIGTLRKRRRVAAIDAFLQQLSPAVPPELLPFASPELLAQHASELIADWKPNDWRRLAVFQPQFAADALTQQLEQSDRYDPRFIAIANVVLPELAKRAPDRAVALLTLLQRHYKLNQLTLDALALVRPQQVVDLLLGNNDRIQLELDPLIDQLRVDQLEQLLNNPADVYDRTKWFTRLRPEQRRELFERNQMRWRNSEGVIAQEIVAALPTDLRLPEARRNMALPIFATQEERRASYAGLLPWDEAREYLRDSLRSNSVDVRGTALAALIGTARYEDRNSDVFALFAAHRREPEPVRAKMLEALQELPPSIWREEDLPELERIITTAFNAVDRSYASDTQLHTLLWRLMPFHPEWATEQFVQFVGNGLQVYEYIFQGRALLVPENVQRAEQTLHRLNQTAQKRVLKEHLATFVGIFRQRITEMPTLLTLVEKHTYDIINTLNWLARYAPKSLQTVVPTLLTKRANWLFNEVVFNYVQRKRPDLLITYVPSLKQPKASDTMELPPVVRTTHWSTLQQQQFANYLLKLQKHSDTYEQNNIIKWLAVLPTLDPSPLLELAELEYVPTYVRDRALQALGQLDSTQGLTTLLDALNDDRSLIAIRSLTHLLKRMPTAQALDILQQIPLKQVTVAKEVIRMCGVLGTPAAYQFLLDQAQQPLHRDVRIALIFALQYFLDQPSAWALLQQTAAEPEAAHTISVLSLPQERITPQHYGNWLQLLAQMLAHPAIEVRARTLSRIVAQPIIDQTRTLYAPLLALLNADYQQEVELAANAFVALYAHDDPSLIADTVQRMLPQRRILHALLEKLELYMAVLTGVSNATIRAVLAVLATEPLTLTYQLSLSIQAQLRDDIIAILRHAASTNDLLHADAITLVIQRMSWLMEGNASSVVADIERTFRADPDPRLRRIALAALIDLADHTSWNDELRALLEQYRADPAPLVAATAQFTFPPDI